MSPNQRKHRVLGSRCEVSCLLSKSANQDVQEKRKMPPKSEVKNKHHLRKGDQTAFETARRLISARCLSTSHASVLHDKLIKHHGNAASLGAICSRAEGGTGPGRSVRCASFLISHQVASCGPAELLSSCSNMILAMSVICRTIAFAGGM